MAAAGDGGPLAALLAGRSKRQKLRHKTLQNLQEEALHLLSCHQNLDDLLLEAGSSVCDKPSHPTSLSGISGEASEPEQLVVSALRDRAATLGVPVGTLSARAAASNIGKICAEAGEAVLLNPQQREKLSCLFPTLKGLLAQNAFCHLQFAQEMWKTQSPLFLEVAWRLHTESLVSLEELLENHPNDAAVLEEWLSHSLRLLCCQAAEPSLAAWPLGSMLTDIAAVFLRHGFKKTCELGKKPGSQKLPKISCAVLESMLAWVLDSVAQESRGEAPEPKAVKCWLHIYSVTAYQGRVPPEALQRFLSHTLAQVLTYNPQLKVSDAVHLQREWCFMRTSPVLTLLFRKLFVLFEAEELIRHLQKVLETSEVNWHHVLSCVSTLLVCHSGAEALVKDFLSQLLRKAFESYDLENMVTAFLIVRQAALEGPAIFMPYLEWFKDSFGSARGFHCTSKKALVFLFKFLSELVPFEAPQYLKVHILHPPFVPTKYRPLLLEYIALAKTRLADFKVSIEDMGVYEDLSVAKDEGQPRSQALQDVEKAVQIFQNTGKIPAGVMEASIFRRTYYTSRFLPALLAPRVLPEEPDTCMALIDALKRAEKIPLNMYATYIEGCQAAKGKFLQGGSTEWEASNLKEPLELLKAELEALRPLIIDPSKHGGMPVQIAAVSEKLTDVLGRPDDEDDAAFLSLRIPLDLSAPDVERQHQGVVDLLLASFCQNVMAASYFLPPDRQGPWPSLFVRMMAGHRPLLPSLLGRLCQLLRHQGSALSDAHLLGLAVFAVHLNQAESLIPAVDICSLWVPHSPPARGLSITGLWEHLLACRTGESVLFCMRFCTAALSYALCKFVSLSHEGLCAVLHPAFVKKLQYSVPRLCVEARGTGREGSTGELPWEALAHPDPCYKDAALGLWKESRFRKLTEEKAFQLTLQEWLLMELSTDPEDDLLPSSERLAFHYWALYQHYLPQPSAAGGCDGDLRKVCATFIGAVLDFGHRSELSHCGPQKNLKSPVSQGRGNADLYCRLQEMLLEVELVHRRAPRDIGSPEGHFLFQLFQERLKTLGNTATLGEKLGRQQEVLLQTRILLGLPPSLLTARRRKGTRVVLDCEGFFSFVNTELKNVCPRGSTLPYDVTAHFFRGLLSASLECDNPAEEVTAALSLGQATCPMILSSAARWWQQMEPVLSSEWERLFQGPLAQGLQRLRELAVSTRRFLASEAALVASSEAPWLSGAFLHFALERRAANDEAQEDALKRLGAGAEKVLVSLLFFPLLDFITAEVAPQEGVDAQKALDWCSKVLRCLEERGVPWLEVFSAAGTGHSPGQILRSTVSDQHLKLLPVAFYSLLLASDSEGLIQEQRFLYVAIDMYTQLLQLFMEGPAEAGTTLQGQGLHGHKLEDPLVLVQRARQFLLRAIPRCPPGSFSNLTQLLDLCGVLDPEIKATLVDFGNEEDPMDDEALLF